MRRAFKKSIAFVLSILLLLSLLPMTALAEDELSYPTIAVGETKRVDLTEGGPVYFQFTPTETGWYTLDSSEEEGNYQYGELTIYRDGGFDSLNWSSRYSEDEHIHLQRKLEAGSTYRFELGCYDMTASCNVTLSKPETYTVRFHSGEGYFWVAGDEDDILEEEYPAGEYLNGWSNPNIVDESKTFSGWAFTNGALTADFSASDYVISGDVDLYAVFGKPITITYDFNGATMDFNGEPQSVYVKSEGAGCLFEDIYVSYPDYSKQLIGWFTKDGEQYTKQSNVMDDLTVYAQWEDLIKVTYDANGGYYSFRDDAGSIDEEYYQSGTEFRAYHPDNSDPSKRFVGYFTAKDGGEQIPNMGYAVLEEMTVYAHWMNIFTVSFDANGGYFYGDQEQTTYQYENFPEGEVLYPPSVENADSALILDGWYDQKTGGRKYDNGEVINGPITLYAHWIQGKQIVFDANGGTLRDSKETTYTSTYYPGEYISEYNLTGLTVVNPNPRKVCIGWSRKKDATKPDEDLRQTKVDDLSTLYAVWTDGVKVTLQAGDGYFPGDYNYETGEQEKFKSIDVYVPSGAGLGSLLSYYSGMYGIGGYGAGFIKAYMEDSTSSKQDFGYRSLTPNGDAVSNNYVFTKDTVLYVLWKDAAKITFDSAEGRFTGVASATPITQSIITVETGVEHVIKNIFHETVASNDSNKAFIGWSPTGKEANIVTSIKPSGDMTLYAVYKQGPTITFQTNSDIPYVAWVNGQRCGVYDDDQAIWPSETPFSELDFQCYAQKSGYLLLAVSLTEDGKQPITDNWYPTKDTTLYLIFAEGYETVFVASPGTFQSNNANYKFVNVKKGEAIGEVEKPVLPGKVFVGWKEYQTQNIIDPKTYVPTEYTQFNAVWEDSNENYEWITKGVDKNYTGIAQEKNGTWYYVKNGEPDLSYTGVKNNEYGWWKIENGIVNFKFHGLAANEYGTWYLKDGKVDFNYTGFAAGTAKGESGWWYVEKGQVKFNKTDILSGTANTAANKAGVSGWWYVINSKVFAGDTVAKNSYGWWAIRGGKVDFNYTGFAKNAYGWWYAESGQVTFKKNDILGGTANTDPNADSVDGWWYVKGSQVTKKTTVANNAYGWWFVKDGQVDFTYNGVESNDYGWWCIHNGKVDFGYTGFEKNAYGWWYIEKGQVTFKKNDVISGKANTDPTAEGEDGWWYVVKSQVTKKTTVAQNAYGWWYVKDGKVDFTYTGLAKNDYGTWYIKDGKVDFSFTGTYEGKQIVKGQVK